MRRQTLAGAVALTRPGNCALTFISVLVGVMVADGVIAVPAAWLAGLAGAGICGGANALNDYYDLEIDRRNKPMRPLPQGVISRAQAVTLAALLSSIGLGISAWLGSVWLLIAGAAVVAGTAYNARLKRRVLIGNVTVSGIAACAFLYGGLLGQHPERAIIPAVFAFLFHLGREVLKDMQDTPGDRLERAMTLPIRYGAFAARMVVTGVFTVLMLMTAVPVVAGWYGGVYLMLVSLVNLALLYVMTSMWRDSSSTNMGRLSGILKADMIVGLLAVCVGR